MGVPFEISPLVGIVVHGTTPRVVPIERVPARSLLTKIICVQTDGPAANFTLELFDNSSVYDDIPASDSLVGYPGVIPEDCFRVSSILASSGGKILHFSEDAAGGHGYSFAPQQRSRNDIKSQGVLYARITSAAVGDKAFAIAIGGEAQVGGV